MYKHEGHALVRHYTYATTLSRLASESPIWIRRELVSCGCGKPSGLENELPVRFGGSRYSTVWLQLKRTGPQQSDRRAEGHISEEVHMESW